MIKKLVLHPFSMALFPILALLAHNISEVAPRVAVRSMVLSLAGAVLLILLFKLISRSWQKAGIISTLFLVLFFSYGQVYELLQRNPIFGFSLGRHRYLIMLYALVFLGVGWLIWRRLRDPGTLTQVLNIVGLLLLVLPIYQIARYTTVVARNEQRSAKAAAVVSPLVLSNQQKLPDVYFIILDGYTRQDALKRDFGYDNTAFLDTLRSMGFYVANCSRSNYPKTQASLAAALNMDYLPQLLSGLTTQGLSDEDVGVLVKQSQVRKLLASVGYSTVAFDSGYEWSRITDANVYLQYSGKPYELQVPQPFEVLLLRTTALLVYLDFTQPASTAYTQATTPFTGVNFIFDDHINRQLFILDELPKLASYSGPKFVFAHIMIPHVPYVFEADGQIATDPGYWSSPGSNGPIDDEYQVRGYTNEIRFLDSRMPAILDTLIKKSSVPPIIVLLGDHGLGDENRWENLSAYYLPGKADGDFYPTITPVNAFRVIFNATFGTHYSLLPDVSYDDSNQPVAETSTACLP